MFNNYIYINSTRNEAVTPNFLLKYSIAFLALIGVYKVFKWLNCLLKFYIRRQQQNLTIPKKPKSNNLPSENRKRKASIRRRPNVNYRWPSDTDLSDEQENFLRELPRVVPTRVNKRKTRPINDFNNFRSAKLKASTSSDSIMGVATAAATAATVFMDRRRHRCCGKCCGKRERKEYI